MRNNTQCNDKNNIQNQVILFDDDCLFCNFWVNFIYKRDKKQLFKFSGLNSHFSQNLKKSKLIFFTDESILLYQKKQNTILILNKSRAIAKIGWQLNFLTKIIALIILITPKFIADFGYDFIAKRRKYIFKKKVNCKIPDENFFKVIVHNI